MAIFSEEDIFRLQVTMDDAALVCRRQAVGNLQSDVYRFANRDRPAIEPLAQGLAL